MTDLIWKNLEKLKTLGQTYSKLLGQSAVQDSNPSSVAAEPY